MRTCSKCNLDKDESCFFIVKKTGKFEYWCKSCKNELKRKTRLEYRKTHPRKYRITLDMVTADGQILCSKCNKPSPSEHYQRGHGGWCRKCRTELEKNRRKLRGMKERKFSKIENGKKLCMECNRMIDIAEFRPNKRGLGGLSAYCNDCRKKKFYDKEKSRVYTMRYRCVNRAQYLVKHRLVNFKRRCNQKILSDGTVTKEFINQLYATKYCYYCNNEIAEKQRTADHKIPLSKNGLHSASNLVMACINCNNSKGSHTDLEFLEILKDKHGI